jgi:D-psicose/D-tagatose/L-ribulose 3-epimerase
MTEPVTHGRRAIGVNTWVWCSPPTDEILDELIPHIAGLGFEIVELPVEQVGDWTPAHVRDLLEQHQLGASICAVTSPGRELIATDSATVTSTQDYFRDVIDIAAEVGSPTVMGPMYASVGRTWRMTDDERRRGYAEIAEHLVPVAAHAADTGVRLGIEPLNRFETSVVNTTSQALEIVTQVDSPALGIALDTFHMSIEERDIPAGVAACGEHLVHVQVCGSDRGAPGGDNIDWGSFFDSLDAVGYDGPICIESFTGDNETIAVAASIWRPLAPTQDQLAIDGLAFLRAL